ncbi:MAG: hypothetical protein U1C74_26495 [Phenylobacterium sp.]|nr:hypothetical protein [Phenylobacterium sp.]
MVRGGMAVEYRQFSGGVYAPVESEARRARRGLWAGSFEQPAAWRAGERATAGGVPQPGPAGCVLKGNINAKGQRIVQAPGQRDYGATRIDPARGERWFCSAEEARAAGWTPAAR